VNAQSFYDVVIVGGGIHGAGVAQACAAAGYQCLLLEKNDWGWATSSRSSKLLHGGLRYLQTGQLKLVRECLQERELLLKKRPGSCAYQLVLPATLQ
jgi:glycerol-3-phosphate dehydrogenase